MEKNDPGYILGKKTKRKQGQMDDKTLKLFRTKYSIYFTISFYMKDQL